MEYADKTSPSIYVKFETGADELGKRLGVALGGKKAFVVIWTTTPWTIPANLAIALHPEVDYVVADTGADRIIVASALLCQVVSAAKIEPQ